MGRGDTRALCRMSNLAQFHMELTNILVLYWFGGALMAAGSRLINLSSSGHRYSNIDLDDPNFEGTSYERMCCNFVVESKVGGFELRNRQWITGVLVGVDDLRRRMVHSAQRFGEEALSGRFFAFSRQKEVDRRTAGVHRPVQLAPLAPDPDVGFVHAPTVVGRFESPAQTSLYFQGVALGPIATPLRDRRAGPTRPSRRRDRNDDFSFKSATKLRPQIVYELNEKSTI
jgi:hypothetical protein